ncbi:hypothetical protein GCK72_005239 [Caenorhabditis remanei]|uniref:Uncharacterized protein n=1 Tax=Caenorhabditis remanei TaxID=31234 RepID=A0A6A5HDT3_CAERE|nr:hypothetical protein GCK72_005239 [Caenorhabditis remanei]KAF1765287.1 hypothetical protein GCK72_005239 [Caenorhabditis remanei]
MCEIDELKQQYGDHRPILIIFLLFLSLLTVSIYMNCRLIVILCQRFAKEQELTYFPMLMLLNIISMINQLILAAGLFLPFVSISEWHGIKYPFIYALVTPSEIAVADIILCAQRIYIHKYPTVMGSFSPNRWVGIIVFALFSFPVGYVSYHAQVYTMIYEEQKSSALFTFFLIDTIGKGVCALFSFIGYMTIYIWSRSNKCADSIIRQALPIAGFQLFTIIVQCGLELQPTKKLDPKERIFLDICFSTACSIAVPLCIMIGESHKREMFYSSFWCCHCYCQPRPPPPKTITEGGSRADRQKKEEEEARKERKREQEERRRRQRDDRDINFHNLDDSFESQL